MTDIVTYRQENKVAEKYYLHTKPHITKVVVNAVLDT